MKKLILALAVIWIAGLSKASANNPVDINRRAVAAFHSEFKKAKNVSWAESPKYVQARFSLDNKIMYAYYNLDGSFVGVIRHMLTSDLPTELQKSIKKEYGSYWVSELFQLNNDQGTTYYIQLENGNESIVLSSDDSEGWKVFSTTNNSGKESTSL
jgi:hypothetical protein